MCKLKLICTMIKIYTKGKMDQNFVNPINDVSRFR